MAVKTALLIFHSMAFSANSLRLLAHSDSSDPWSVDHDHIVDDSTGDSKPGSPVVPKFEIQPSFEKEQWRVNLGERLWAAAKVEEEVMHKCGGFISFGDATLCKKALPTEKEQEGVHAMRGVHDYDLGSVPKSVTQEDDFVALSYGIQASDLWSMYMSNLWHLKTDLFDCYYDDKNNPGPLGTDMHNPECGGHEMYDRKCYKTPYTAHRVCVNSNLTSRQKAETMGEREGEPLSAQLENRKPLSVFLKMDVEGCEWEALEKLLDSPKDMAKIRSIDMEVHINKGCTNKDVLFMRDEEALERKVKIMELLSKKFAPIGSTLEAYHRSLAKNFRDDPSKFSHPDNVYTSNGFGMDQWCMSWVNRQIL